MDFVKGMIVISRAGRDKGSALAVLEVGERHILVADGKERPLERPKKKNPKHLMKTRKTVPLENLTNKGLRKALREQLQQIQECE